MNRREALQVLTAMPAVTHIARADLTPTSVVVVECMGLLSADGREHIRAQLAAIWPQNRIVVLDERMRLKVLG
jgi:hypothetical protein